MIDVVEALRIETVVEVTKPTGVGERRGWQVARHIITKRLSLWLVAAGLDVPALPAVDGFDDVPAVLELLDALPVQGAIHCTIEQRALGQRLAGRTQIGPLSAVETALKHARYAPEDERRLCAVQNSLARVLPMLATLAAARHERLHGTLDGFNVGPWERATARLADSLTP